MSTLDSWLSLQLNSQAQFEIESFISCDWKEKKEADQSPRIVKVAQILLV